MSTMTQTRHPGPSQQTGRPAPRARLISGRLALALMSSFGALTSFYLLLSVTPMYAVSAGAGSAEAGVVTGSLMLATVAAEFASARLMRRYGYRTVFAAGALLLGGPALALLGPHSVVMIVAVSIARGLGFGLNTVVIGALVATALPPGRRGEGIGLAGVVACVPAIVALPSGVWLAGNAGYAVVIVITAVSALAPLAAVPWLAGPAGRRGSGSGRGAAGRAAGQPAIRRPAAALAGLRGDDRVGRRGRRVPAARGRGVRRHRRARAVRAGRGLHGEPLVGRAPRRPARPRRPAGPGTADGAAGMGVLIWVAAPAALITGMCLFGIGFGISQNATFALMIDRAPVSGYGTASALWNLAYDAGYGAGPAVFGVFVVYTGYPAAFALTGMLMLAALVPALRDRAAQAPAASGGQVPGDVETAVAAPSYC